MENKEGGQSAPLFLFTYTIPSTRSASSTAKKGGSAPLSDLMQKRSHPFTNRVHPLQKASVKFDSAAFGEIFIRHQFPIVEKRPVLRLLFNPHQVELLKEFLNGNFQHVRARNSTLHSILLPAD